MKIISALTTICACLLSIARANTEGEETIVVPACDVSFCEACFVFCGVPPYTCKVKETAKRGVISPCEIDPICAVCQDLCPKQVGDDGECPAHACKRYVRYLLLDESHLGINLTYNLYLMTCIPLKQRPGEGMWWWC